MGKRQLICGTAFVCADRRPQLKEHIYSSTPEPNLYIGKRNAGHISNYYLGEVITDDEVAAVQSAAEKLGVDVLNTRYVALCIYVTIPDKLSNSELSKMGRMILPFWLPLQKLSLQNYMLLTTSRRLRNLKFSTVTIPRS